MMKLDRKYLSARRAFVMPLFVAATFFTGSVSSQVIDGVDYTARAGDAANTFDMTNTDILGQRFASEHRVIEDEVTGVPVIALTTSRHNNSKFYQTHPQWTPDGKYIIFPSSRGGGEGRRGLAYAISMETYEIVQVTTADWGSNLHLGWHENRAYFFRDRELIALDLGRLLADSERGQVGAPESYLETIAELPAGVRPSGGTGLDANEDRIFFAARSTGDLSAIYSIEFSSGELRKLVEVPFRANHLQANPYVSGEIMYCWETGGDAPQRMWYLSIDDSGEVHNRPIYVEHPAEWVTHELFTGPDHILFNVMAHIDRLRERPTGIFSLNIRTGEHKNHGQIGKGGFWHCDATEDQKWAVGDTFDGELYRIDMATGEQTLLTTGHRPNSKGPFSNEAHSHHNISPDEKWVLLTSSMLTGRDIMLVPLHP